MILVDESGDLGFSPHSSRNFVVAAMAIPKFSNLDRLTGDARKTFGKKDRIGELKFNDSMDSTRTVMLEGVAKPHCQIAWASFEKNKLPPALIANKHLLYSTACSVVLPELFIRVPTRKMHIVMDRCFPKRWGCDRLDEQVMSLLATHHAGNFVQQVWVSQFDSLSSRELQVHDFVVGAIFQHVERGVDEHIDIIRNNIIFGRKL